MAYFGRKTRMVIWIAARMGRKIDYMKANAIAARFCLEDLYRINKVLGGRKV